MKIIDLRSDTVTLPTGEMRQAMFEAVLGDDVFNEDPTVNEFEQRAAEIVGMEAALLVTSGTQANLVSVLTHCARGEEIILGDASHIFLNEAGGISAVGGIHPHTIPNQPDGTLKLEDIRAAVRGDDEHWPRTRLLCLENTHNRCYGAPLTPDYIDQAAACAREFGLKVHCDGARIFNAAVALGVDVKELTRSVDSLAFCLSKGLSAPVGSVVCGTSAFIREARRNRKVLGGGMRQCGIIAAPGMVALESMITRLKDDHENAQRFALGIKNIPGLSIETERVRTNIVYFDLVDEKITTAEFLDALDKTGVKLLDTGPRRFRAVTHYGIEQEDIDRALDAIHAVLTH
jgi:threonine aldolase